jgi:two-component system, cell cycle response regulator DivK
MSKRILVVEDQPDNRQIIRDMLAPTDYEITEAENGEEALAAIAKQRPDLILMDIQLPIIDGYTATSRIKADPALRSIPIIAVTSYALSGEEKKARAAGCDDYVPKPDALEFPDGQIVLLTFLREGQPATVLQLPAEPKTASEAEAQRRATYVG